MEPAGGNLVRKLGSHRWALVAAWLGLTVALLYLPAPPPADVGLDSSWNLCLTYLFQHGFHFGDDIIFTFGPLGFTMYETYAGSGFWPQFALAIVFSGMSAWVLLASVRLLRWPFRILALLAVLLLVAPDPDALTLLDTVLVAVLLLRDEGEGRVLIPACCGILGFLALTKFTNFILAATVVAIITGYFFLRRDRRRSMMIACGFVIALCGCWVLCRQPLSGIASYVLSSLQMSKGYTDAMYDYTRTPGWSGCATGLLLGLLGAFEAVKARRSLRGLALILVYFAASALAWRHASVRADPDHLFTLYLWALPVVAFQPMLFPEKGRMIPRAAFMVLLGVCAIEGIRLNRPAELGRCIPRLMERLRANAIALADPAAFKADLDSRYAAIARKNASPRISEAIGNDTVDVLGFEQGAAILNGLNYTPRPVFQSYGAYTPELEETNFAFLAGDSAPQWVLQRYQTIDNRYPTMDDGLALRALLDRYTFQFEDDGYVLWHRDASRALTSFPPLVRAGNSSFNQAIQVGDFPADSNLWLEVDYSYNLAGKLRAAFDKPPAVNLIVNLADPAHTSVAFRLPRLLGREGMLLSPYLPGVYEFLRYACGLGGAKVASFSIECSDKDAKYLQPDFHYHLRLLPDPYNLPRNRMMADRIKAFPMFETRPVAIRSPLPTTEVSLDGRDALLVYAPGSVALMAPAGGGRLRGSFGLTSYAGTTLPPAGKGPLAEFQVLVRESGTQRLLFDRLLNPSAAEGDRGLQPLDLALPAAPPGSILVLNTISRAPGSTGANLTCWTGLDVEPQTAIEK